MNPWEGNQVSLELVQIDVEGTIESQGAGDGGDDLGDQSVEVGERWRLDTEVSSADVVDSLIVDHEGAVNVLEGGVRGQDGVVLWQETRERGRTRPISPLCNASLCLLPRVFSQPTGSTTELLMRGAKGDNVHPFSTASQSPPDDLNAFALTWVDGELELALLAVVSRESLEEESTEPGAGTTAEGVEDEEA